MRVNLLSVRFPAFAFVSVPMLLAFTISAVSNSYAFAAVIMLESLSSIPVVLSTT